MGTATAGAFPLHLAGPWAGGDPPGAERAAPSAFSLGLGNDDLPTTEPTGDKAA